MTEVKKAHPCGDTTYGRLPKHQCCTSCSNPEHKKEATNTQACNRRDRNEQDSTDQQIQGHARSTKGNQGGRPKRIPTVTEVYSRPRVTAYAETHAPGHIKAGPAYDLCIGHDFTDEKARDTAKNEIDQEDTDVVLMCPRAQNSAHNRDPMK